MLNVALKEWKLVCDLLVTGELSLLLRKGGIHEWAGPGRFELAHQRFLFFPSWMHQKPAMIKESCRDRIEMLDEEPSEITFHGYGEATHCWQVPSRQAFDSLDDLHCWSPAQIDMRFDYKPDRPLYLLAVRAYRLAQPITIANDVSYSGCKSWVTLVDGTAVDESGAAAVMADDLYDALVARVTGVMGD